MVYMPLGYGVARPTQRRLPTAARLREWICVACLLGCCYTVVVHITYVAAASLTDPDGQSQNLIAAADGSAWKKVSFITLFSIALLFGGWRTMATSISIPYFLSVIWCIASCTWAIDPSISFRRSIAMAMILFAVATSIKELGPTKTLQTVYFFLATIVLASFISVMLSSIPIFSFAIHPQDEGDPTLVGAWRGVMLHKNVAGAMMTHASIIFLHFALNRKRKMDWFFFALTIIFLIGTKSKTSIGLAGGVLFVGLAYRYMFSRTVGALNFVFSAVLIIAAALLTASVLSDQITHFFSQRENLSGRVAIWMSLISYIRNHLWLGSGYGSFWAIGVKSPVYAVAVEPFIYNIGHSHSGYMEILLTVGLIGLVLALITLVFVPGYRIMTFDYKNRDLGAMCMSIWFFGVLQNFTESQFFSADKESWLFVLIEICLVHNAGMQQIADRKAAANRLIVGRRKRANVVPLFERPI